MGRHTARRKGPSEPARTHPGMTEFSLMTRKGSIEIRLAQGSHKCVSKNCNVQGGGLGEFVVHDVERDEPDLIYICGNCLAKGLAFAVVEPVGFDLPTPTLERTA
jgi:hypothetical protein